MKNPKFQQMGLFYLAQNFILIYIFTIARITLLLLSKTVLENVSYSWKEKLDFHEQPLVLIILGMKLSFRLGFLCTEANPEALDL